MYLDDTEKKLLLLLQSNGRMTFVEMADRIGVSERTVSRKYHRLVDEGVFRIVAFANPFLMGHALPAIIGLKIRNAHLSTILGHLIDKPDLRFVSMTAGSYDVVVEGYFKSAAHLLTFVTDGMAYEGIRLSHTYMVLRLYKFSYEWGLGVAPNELERLYSELGLPSEHENAWGTDLTRRVGPALQLGDRVTSEGPEPRILQPLERRIVKLLQEDGRRPFGDIAKHTEVTEETVRRKVQAMIDDGVLKIAAFVRPALTGLHMPVILHLAIDRSRIEDIAAELGRSRQVAYVAAVTGPSDIIAACYLRDSRELMGFLTDELGSIQGIRQADVSLMLGVRKRQYR